MLNILELEKIFNNAVDIEWAIKDNILYILQSRPITTCFNNFNFVINNNLDYKYIWSTNESMWNMELGFKLKANLLSQKIVFNKEYDDFFYFKENQNFFYYKKNNKSNYLTNEILLLMLNKIESDYCHQKTFFLKLENINFSQLNNLELLNIFFECIDFYCNWLSMYAISEPDVIHESMEYITLKTNEEELQELLQTNSLDLMAIENQVWTDLIKKPYDKNLILDHIKQFPFLVLNFSDLDIIFDIFKTKFYNSQTNFFNYNVNFVKNNQEKILKNYNDIKLNQSVELIHRLSLSRMKIKNGWAGLHFFMLPFFQNLEKRFKESSFNLLNFYFVDDIKNLLVKNIKLEANILQNRNTMIWHYHLNKIDYLYENQAKKYFDNLLNSNYNNFNKKNLKGSVANIGDIKGLAYKIRGNNIVELNNAINNVTKQHIIVSDMIQPNMNLIIEKSSGVITQEGGILSHAAIICRELNVPCIVGVPNIMNIISNKDTIEIKENGLINIY